MFRKHFKRIFCRKYEKDWIKWIYWIIWIFNGYDFSVDYNTIDTSNIIDIHKYLMKKHNIINIIMFGLIYLIAG